MIIWRSRGVKYGIKGVITWRFTLGGVQRVFIPDITLDVISSQVKVNLK